MKIQYITANDIYNIDNILKYEWGTIPTKIIYRKLNNNEIIQNKYEVNLRFKHKFGNSWGYSIYSSIYDTEKEANDFISDYQNNLNKKIKKYKKIS